MSGSRKKIAELIPAGIRALHTSSPLGAALPAVNDSHRTLPKSQIDVPSRTLMGPGPSNAYPRVLQAQALPLLGHMHPPMIKIMDEVREGLQYLFQTESKYTCLLPGPGHAGMEASIANLVEPGETVVVANKGIWGSRVVDLSERYGAKVVDLQKTAGEAFSYDDFKKAVETHKPAALFIVHGESSTGVLQNLEGLGELCKRNGTLLIVDTVCTLGGVPLFADSWGIDCIYSGSQKCLSGPPGTSPFFLSERAMDKVKGRKSKVGSYYLDSNLIGSYWGWSGARSYHHTGPVSAFYAMREALSIASEEGLPALYARHQAMHERLWEGLTKLNLKPWVKNPAHRLATVNTIEVPQGVDWAKVCGNAMDKYSLEIAGGLGPSVGKVWRIGVMGFNAKPQNIDLVVKAFEDGLKQQKFL